MQEEISPQERADALYRLWKCYLHMRAWGLPEYETLIEQDREDFTAGVKAGTLLAFVEDSKRAAVRAGEVPDDKESWLLPLCAARIQDGKPLPQAERDELGRITTAMYGYLVRFDAALPEFLATATAAGKGVALRNAWFLQQWEARGKHTYHSPKKIQEKWFGMTEAARGAICPDACGKASLDTVQQGIKRARKARDGKPSKPAAKRKRTARKA